MYTVDNWNQFFFFSYLLPVRYICVARQDTGQALQLDRQDSATLLRGVWNWSKHPLLRKALWLLWIFLFQSLSATGRNCRVRWTQAFPRITNRTSWAMSECKPQLPGLQVNAWLLLFGRSLYNLSISSLVSLLAPFPARFILQYLTVVNLQFQIANTV